MAAVDRIAWWQWVPLPGRKWRVVAHVAAGDEVPDRLPQRGVVLVGPHTKPTWIAFDCPCQRGHRIMVNLDRARRPVWRLEPRQPLSIRPSIDAITAERRCHFFVSNGKIDWADDQKRTVR
jgi:hypothetical protein